MYPSNRPRRRPRPLCPQSDRVRTAAQYVAMGGRSGHQPTDDPSRITRDDSRRPPVPNRMWCRDCDQITLGLASAQILDSQCVPSRRKSCKAADRSCGLAALAEPRAEIRDRCKPDILPREGGLSWPYRSEPKIVKIQPNTRKTKKIVKLELTLTCMGKLTGRGSQAVRRVFERAFVGRRSSYHVG